MDKEKEKDEKDETEIKGKRKTRETKKTDFSIEELQDKFTRLFNTIAYFWKVDNSYSDSDFLEESKDLARLAKKYPIIGDILTFLDPLFLVLGLFSKLKVMLDKVKRRKDREKKEKEDKVKDDVINGNNNITKNW
nr:hypothetical protein [uncultured bacterium]